MTFNEVPNSAQTFQRMAEEERAEKEKQANRDAVRMAALNSFYAQIKELQDQNSLLKEQLKRMDEQIISSERSSRRANIIAIVSLIVAIGSLITAVVFGLINVL